MRTGQLKIGVIDAGNMGMSFGAWLREGPGSKENTDIQGYIARARRAEAAKLHFIFIADTLHITPVSPPHFLNRLEPLTMLGAIAVSTSHIGLVATLSTTYTEPFTVARQLASLDLISNGRAGWNIVTSGLDGAALNHSLDDRLPIEDRYRRAGEHVEVVKGLWDSWEDDAFVKDKERRKFFDPEKMHKLMHKGEFFRVDGPLNIARSHQGYPVLFQAGASKDGRRLAASTADAIFSGRPTREVAKEYIDDVKGLAVAMGRRREDIVFLPSIQPIVRETDEEVEKEYTAQSSLVSYEDAIKSLSFPFAYHDFSKYDPDAPFPDLGDLGSHSYRSITDRIKKTARDEKLTLRQVALRFGLQRTEFIGTTKQVADACESWFREGICDGFMISPNEAFYDLVIPELQRRGLFHREYEAETFRENMGLRPVPNRYTAQRLAAKDSA
jgi:N-acetyl-S-(2-succino)cysteine monooxygenase